MKRRVALSQAGAVSVFAAGLVVKAACLFSLFCLVGSTAFGACHVVTPSGSGSKTGADWNNALGGIPSALVRGDIYYLSDGTYPAYTFSTATSGGLTLEIRKAQTTDHCTDTGWNATTMGSSQAVFQGTSTPLIGINTSYVTVNGNGTQSGPGCGGTPGSSYTSEPSNPHDCGIRVDNTGCTSSTQDACDRPIFIEGAFTNYTFEYVEIVGNGNNLTDEMEVEAPYGGAGPSTFTHLYARNAGCVYLQYGGNNRTVSSSYFWGTEVNGASGSNACHGQAEYYTPPDSNYTSYNNVYRDITGSTDITFGMTAGTSNNILIYNNVFWASNGATHNGGLNLGTITDGILGCFNSGVVCTNVGIYQNTIVNVGWGSGVDLCDSGTGCTATIENNLWYYSYSTSGVQPPGFVGIGTYTQKYNSFLQSGAGCTSGTADVCDASAPNPFVGWTTGNFNLASENADWDNRLASVPYGSETTDRGAYQFAGAITCSVSPAGAGPYTAGQAVSVQFAASNCSSSTFTISSGSLAGSGLTLSSAGLLSGTAQAGTFGFTVAYGTATDPISLTINAAPSIITNSLAAGQVNVSYSQSLATSGGTGAVACAVTTGSLPAGLTLSGCTISGTPTTANTYNFSVTPTDANGVSGIAHALSILINPPNTSTPVILHTTFCGPGLSWPGTCTLSAPTTAGSRLVVVYSSYNSAGSAPVMNSITDSGGDAFSELTNARSINTNSATSWNDIWSASGVAAGQTALTINPSTTEPGDVYVWEVQYASNVVGCASLSSQPAANPAVGASMTAGTNTLLLSHLHPAPNGNPTAVSSPFTSDLLTDGMGYAHYTALASGTSGPQWAQTAETFAAGTCGFSAFGSVVGPTAPATVNTAVQ